MTREEAITNLNMIRVAFGVPVTKEQKELVDDTFEMAIQALENHDTFMKYAYSQGKQDALSQEPTVTSTDEPMTMVYPTIVCDDAISREAVIGWLKDKDIIKLKSQEENARKELMSLPSATQKSGKWIPVSERLPEWDIECLVVDDKGEFGVGFYRDDAKAWDSPIWGWLERAERVDNYEAYTEPCGMYKVVAWMPLPKAYKPQESEEQTE